MKKIILFVFLVGGILACSKDSFETKPTLKITSVSDEIVPIGQDLKVVLEFTDKEGDVYTDDPNNENLTIIRSRLNKRGTSTDSVNTYSVPTFPKRTKGEIELTLGYTSALTRALTKICRAGVGCTAVEPDTLRLGFVLRDLAGNKSDTAYTTVQVIRQ